MQDYTICKVVLELICLIFQIEDATLDFDETIHLERGQNLFEIHVHKVRLDTVNSVVIP